LVKTPTNISGDRATDKNKSSAASSLPKRFYKNVSVAPKDAGFAIKLDARSVRTPQGSEFSVPTQALATALAGEWEAQTERIDPASMPLTKLCNSTLDGVSPNRQIVINDVAKFSGHDAVCYRAQEPEGLVARQSEFWDPVLNWAEKSLGVRWVCAGGVMPVTQEPNSADAIKTRLTDTCPFQLAALHELTTLSGSALLALAYQDGAISFERLWQASNVDEDWQIERWGADGEAEARRKIRLEDARAADRLFALAIGD